MTILNSRTGCYLLSNFISSRIFCLLGFGTDTGIVAPEPAQRLRQNRAPMFAVVAFSAEVELVIVAAELQRSRHFLVGQRPVAMQVVEVLLAILQEDADWFLFRLANQRRIDMPAPDISEAANVTEHFAKSLRMLPGDRPGTDASGTDATNGASCRVFRDIISFGNFRQD